MYTAVMFIGINNCSTVQPVVAIERTVYYRERAAGMYAAFPYAFAQVEDQKQYQTYIASACICQKVPMLRLLQELAWIQ
jgi:ABC-2 type transporter